MTAEFIHKGASQPRRWRKINDEGFAFGLAIWSILVVNREYVISRTVVAQLLRPSSRARSFGGGK